MGVREAITNLQNILGTTLLGPQDNNLIRAFTARRLGRGCGCGDRFRGPVVKTVVVGLLSDVSLQSVRRLAKSTYSRIVETLDLSDQRRPDPQMDSIVRLRPDLVLLAGGTEWRRARSIQNCWKRLGLPAYLMPMEKRPMVLYAGNHELAGEVQELLGGRRANCRSATTCARRLKQKT